MSTLLKEKVPGDPVLLRFLRARDFNIEKGIFFMYNRVRNCFKTEND